MTLRTEEPRTVEIGPLRLKGLLGVPDHARGLVIFAHGSVMSFNPRPGADRVRGNTYSRLRLLPYLGVRALPG